VISRAIMTLGTHTLSDVKRACADGRDGGRRSIKRESGQCAGNSAVVM